MPRTKLGMMREKNQATYLKGLASKREKISRRQSITTSEWKYFCDTVFEFYVRWRDGWVDGLDGRKFEPGNYENYHACHFIPRGGLSTRYMAENCHGQSSGHNFGMSVKAPSIIRNRTQKLYNDFLVKKYGQEKVDELYELSKQICRGFDWVGTAQRVYSDARQTNSEELDKRLSQRFKTFEEKHVLNLILQEIKNV